MTRRESDPGRPAHQPREGLSHRHERADTQEYSGNLEDVLALMSRALERITPKSPILEPASEQLGKERVAERIQGFLSRIAEDDPATLGILLQNLQAVEATEQRLKAKEPEVVKVIDRVLKKTVFIGRPSRSPEEFIDATSREEVARMVTESISYPKALWLKLKSYNSMLLLTNFMVNPSDPRYQRQATSEGRKMAIIDAIMKEKHGLEDIRARLQAEEERLAQVLADTLQARHVPPVDGHAGLHTALAQGQLRVAA